MDKFDTFEAIFDSASGKTYESKDIDSITRHRRLLENTLFFDRLLNAVGIRNAAENYPPHSQASLKLLYNSIWNAPATDTHKAALFYYLRKDLRLSAENFAQEAYLPERYIILIDGLWHLDRLRLREAVIFLTEPTLIPTFSEEILYTLSRNATNHPELALEYYNSTSPVFTSTKTLNAYFSVLSSASVTEAFFFTRRQADYVRRHLFEYLVSQVHGSSSGEKRARRSLELVELPFDEEEEEWFEKYLLDGKGKGLFGAKDTVIVRRIATGRGDDVRALAREIKERKIDGVNWNDLAKGLAFDCGRQ